MHWYTTIGTTSPSLSYSLLSEMPNTRFASAGGGGVRSMFAAGAACCCAADRGTGAISGGPDPPCELGGFCISGL